METRLAFFTCLSLVDITDTGVTRSTQQGLARNQQRNWETIIQVLGLRAQPMMISEPTVSLRDMWHVDFGEYYVGTHRVWSFNFASEHAGVYTVPILLGDCDQVPCIARLTSTATLPVPVFRTHGPTRNTYFQGVQE
jgi:hypothetical protein